MKTAIIGVGRMGGALAIALDSRGYVIEYLITNHPEKTETIASRLKNLPKIASLEQTESLSADLLFIAVPDSQIASVVRMLSGKVNGGSIIFHTSGALSSKILEPLKTENCLVGSFHPLVSVSSAETGAERFENVYFCLEGDDEAVEIARTVVRDLHGNPFAIAAEYKSLYHAAAVMTSGHTVALFSVAVEALEDCGVEKTTAQKILLPLLQSTLDNLKFQTPAESLTGTFSRTDLETMNLHLASLKKYSAPEIFDIYLQLGVRSLHLAEERGANPERVAEMRRRLKEFSNEPD